MTTFPIACGPGETSRGEWSTIEEACVWVDAAVPFESTFLWAHKSQISQDDKSSINEHKSHLPPLTKQSKTSRNWG